MMNEIIQLQNEIDFLYKENKMLSQKADELKKWYGVEKILRDAQRNEYLFVNLIPELEYE